MQRMDNSALSIVIVDYQSCIFSPENDEIGNKHFLSPKLVEFIRDQHYDHFIGHTFRCFVNIDYQRHILSRQVAESEVDRFKKNFPTVKITKHIVKHAATHCLTVSTLDDMVTRQVGLGYQDLENYEMNGVIPENKHVQKDQLFDFMRQNNEQLLLIAQYIASKFPDRQIQLDIIDDDLKHGRDALTADQQRGWPSNIKINAIYRYSTKTTDDRITRIAENDIKLAKNNSGLFASAAASSPASATTEPRRSARLEAKRLRR